MYQGEDLILAMGAPGSRWSGSIRCIQSQIDINTSDERPELTYDGEMGWHRGAYWGPNHTQGHNFDRLDDMDYSECLTEFKRPFTDWNTGIKIIKSHWFSYHIPQLREWFPKAKLIAFYMPDDFCFDWWHKVGGWNITYPHYEWYENDERMRLQIEIENACIQQEFHTDKKNLAQILDELGLTNNLHSADFLINKDRKFKELSESLNKPVHQIIENTLFRTPVGIL